MSKTITQQLLKESAKRPILLIFLRHLGCAFARKALLDLKAQRNDIETLGASIAVVVMSPEGKDSLVLERFSWPEMRIIRDPQLELYREFGVARGNLRQILPPRALLRGLHLAFTCGLGVGVPQGECMRLGSVFLLSGDNILNEARYQTSADETDFTAFVRKGLGLSSESCGSKP